MLIRHQRPSDFSSLHRKDFFFFKYFPQLPFCFGSKQQTPGRGASGPRVRVRAPAAPTAGGTAAPPGPPRTMACPPPTRARPLSAVGPARAWECGLGHRSSTLSLLGLCLPANPLPRGKNYFYFFCSGKSVRPCAPSPRRVHGRRGIKVSISPPDRRCSRFLEEP